MQVNVTALSQVTTCKRRTYARIKRQFGHQIKRGYLPLLAVVPRRSDQAKLTKWCRRELKEYSYKCVHILTQELGSLSNVMELTPRLSSFITHVSRMTAVDLGVGAGENSPLRCIRLTILWFFSHFHFPLEHTVWLLH